MSKPTDSKLRDVGAVEKSVTGSAGHPSPDSVSNLPATAEKAFFDSMIESMPGILYCYDQEGRFIRWNRNFEFVSGYSTLEIANMHPLDFFDAAARPRLRERIREVFENGESSVEAPFRIKSGALVPYFFTGRRVLIDGKRCLVGIGIDISARVRAEEELAQSERKYRELVQHANSIILRWDAAGRVTFLNEFGQRFFGYTEHEIVGKHVMDTIVPSTETSGRDLGQLMAQICADPQSFEQNTNENMRRNGERVWISWTNRIECDSQGRVVGILSVGTDITEQRRAEAKLRQSEADLIEAQRVAKMGSWQLDIRTNQLKWSEQVAEIFGIPPTESAGPFGTFLEFVHPDDRARAECAVQAARAGQDRLDVELRIVLRDGTEKVVHELADLIRDEQKLPMLLSGTVHDVTDRVRIEAEREKRYRAEEADRVKSAFLATMSHELRTPLNSIIGFTGILRQGLAGPLNDEQAKQLDMVRTSARHLLALVNDVLDISKIEAGQLEVSREAFDVRRSIEKVVSLVAPQAESKHLQLRVELGGDLGHALGDMRRFEQILLNLLGNAIKFTDQGHVALSAHIVFDASASPCGAIRLQVVDTGIGIKPDELPSLFQPFRQGDSGLARKHEGTGLGLAICRRLADLMGGQITVESEWGKGSTFTLTMPMNSRLGS